VFHCKNMERTDEGKDEHAAQLVAKGGRTWEPMMGRARKDRIVVPEVNAGRVRSLRAWAQKAVDYAQSG